MKPYLIATPISSDSQVLSTYDGNMAK